MQTAVQHNIEHQLQMELWLRELSFLNDEINILKKHLHTIDADGNPEITEKIARFSHSFALQKKWLHKMREELVQMEQLENGDWMQELEDAPGVKSFRLQMRANRLVNQELKDNVSKFLVKWM